MQPKKTKKTNDKVGNKTTNKEGKKNKERAREEKNRNSFAKKGFCACVKNKKAV